MGDIFNLEGKVALVTGGNGGIGLGMAEAMAGAGAKIAIWGTNADKNAAALEKLRALTEAEAWICNVADASDVNARMADTVAHFGRLDGCFANAGVSGRGNRSYLDISEEEWRLMMSINLDGVHYTYQAALRHMVERGEQRRPGRPAGLRLVLGLGLGCSAVRTLRRH